MLPTSTSSLQTPDRITLWLQNTRDAPGQHPLWLQSSLVPLALTSGISHLKKNEGVRV